MTSGEESLDVYQVDVSETLMTPYKRYLADGMLLAKPVEAKVIKKNSGRYTLVDGKLFKHGYTHPVLTYVSGVPAGWPGYTFLCDLARLLGHPFLVICEHLQRSEQMGALAAVCTPTLKSARKKHQKLCTFVLEPRIRRSEGDKELYIVCCFLVLTNNPSLIPCA